MQLFVVLVKLTNVVALVKVAAVVNAPDGEELSACVCVCVLMTAEVHLI